MKKLLIVLIVFLLFSCMGFATELDYVTYQAPKTTTPPVKDVDILKFVRAVAVQIIVPTTRYYRKLNWYKLEDGEIDHDKLDRDKEQWGYEWFKQGWRVVFGDWCTKEKAQDVKICGSGVILYSSVLPEGLRVEGKTHGASYILTNAHVVDVLVDYYSTNDYEKCGSRLKPLDIYYTEDMVEKNYPPGLKIRQNAKPYEQIYFVPKSNYISILHSEDQLYRVEAKIVVFDLALDIALLQLNNVWGLPYAVFRGTPCQVGEEVWICGAPLALPFSIDKGRVNQVDLDLGDDGVKNSIVWNNQIKLDIAAAPGSSGSGIFDIYGHLIAEEHGVLVYRGNYISGGHLAIDGMAIREFLIWNGYSFIVDQKPWARIRE
jgi:S1-C subfamily serine protease